MTGDAYLRRLNNDYVSDSTVPAIALLMVGKLSTPFGCCRKVPPSLRFPPMNPGFGGIFDVNTPGLSSYSGGNNFRSRNVTAMFRSRERTGATVRA